MKKYCFSILYIILSLFIFTIDVYAADDTCDFKTKAELAKKAANITARAEVAEENGKEVFKITVYNLTEDFYIIVRKEGKGIKSSDYTAIHASQAKDQAYTFTDANTEKIIKYKFTVRSNIEGCIQDITSFSLVKPMKNYHYNMSYCKYKEVVDYYYCQEWIKTEFNLSDEEIQQRVEKKRDSLTTTTTAYCPSCELEEEQNNRANKLFEIKKYIIIGLVVGIIADLIVIGVLLRDLKRRGL